MTAAGLFGIVAAAGLFWVPTSARADVYWQVQSGDWSVAQNWGGTLPGIGDTAYVANGGTVTVTTMTATCYGLSLGNIPGSGTVQMAGGSLTTSYDQYVGDLGTGAFVQSGGSNTITAAYAGSLYLGYNPTCSGTYSLSGGQLSAPQTFVGYYGTGTFVQSGGAHNVGSTLFLGDLAGSSGTYSLSGNSLLSAPSEDVGRFGTGNLAQSGGTNSVSSLLGLGIYSGANSTYYLSGGVVSASAEQVGCYFGSGAFMQCGGTNISDSLILGLGPGSNGTYGLSGGSLSASAAEVGNSGTGAFTQSGGTHSIGSNLFLGYNAGSSGVYNLSDGQLSAPNAYVGYSGTGTFTQSGGTHNIGNNLVLGYNAGSSGTYSLSGSGQLSAPSEMVGAAGMGTFTQYGGTNTVSLLSIGSSGSYLLAGGTLQVTGNLVNQGSFAGNGTPATLIANGIVDLSGVQNLQALSVSIGANSLLIVPAGFDPSMFASYGNSGLVHAVGTTLTVPAGQGFSGMGTIGDPISCQGSITAAFSGSINLSGGLNLSGTGAVSLGNGNLTTNDASSAIGGGSLLAANHFVGNGGTGTFTQSGGSNSVGFLYLGYNAGDSGTYSLNGTGQMSTNTAYVGYSGTGAFTQCGGGNSVGNYLYLGFNAAGSGAYNLSGSGQVSENTAYVGYSGTGAFTQWGGSNNVGNYLYLGFNAASSGAYNLSGSGQLSTSYAYAGYSGTGTFTQSGGTHIIGKDLNLGYYASGSGTYSLSGSGQLSASSEYVGNRGRGMFAQSGGTNRTTNILYVGNSVGSSGTYYLGGDGQLSTYGEDVGDVGTGTFTQTGGSNTIAGSLDLGLNRGGNGTYVLSGNGQMSATFENLGGLGTGTFTQSGGANKIAGPLGLGHDLGGSGTYNLNGGLLVLSYLAAGPGSTAFNFSGGTLQAGGAISTTVPMTLGAGGGGATFDTAGYNVTLSGSLSGPGSLTKVDSGALILAAANTYSGNTLIGGGTLALGSPLALQNSTLDTSGSGTLTFGALATVTLGGLSGPGGVSLANSASVPVALQVGNNGADTTFSGTLNGPGSLTKVGGGTLLLSGSNSYTGATSVNNGTLALDFSAIGAPGSNIINISNSSALTLGRGALAIQGNTGTANSQQFNGVSVNAGGSVLQAVSGSGGTLSVNVGAIARYPAGTIDFVLPASGGITTTTTASTTGPPVLVDNNGTAYATVNGGSAFATVSGGQIVGLTSYSDTNSFPGSAIGTTLITQNLSPDNGAASAGVVAFGSPNATLTLTGNNDLADAGGILVTPAATGTLITGGSLHAGGGNAVVIMNYGSLNVASAIVDNAPGASVTVSGSGVTTLTGTSSYTGATYINNGAILQVGMGGSGALIGSTSGVVDNGTLIFNHGDAITFSQRISGLGSLTQCGSGILIVTNSNSYTGPTTISGGTLQMGNGAANGSIANASAINDNATLVYDVVGSQSCGNAISGSGALYKMPGGTLTLTGNNTFSGPTIVGGGSLVGNTASLPSAIILANNAIVIFNQATSGVFSNVISGAGSLTMSGSGTLILTGSNSYTGGTFVSGGTLQVGDGGDSGTLGAGSVTNNGTLSFSRSDTALTVGSAISGTGSLVQNGSGMVTLSAVNYYTGPTSISSGTLQIGTGTKDGSIGSSSAINDNAALAFNLVGSQSYGKVIGGVGALYKTGGGTLTLTGNNTYTGGTTIRAGVLQASVTAALPGYATPGAISVAGGATLYISAGGSGWTGAGIGSLLVGNSGGFASGSVLAVDTSGGNVSCNSNIGGNLGLTKLGGNTLTLSGSDTCAGPTVVAAGTLQIGAGGVSGSVGGNIIDNSVVIFDRSGPSLTYSNVISGTGSVIQAGPASLLFTGSNTYTSSTTINGGTLQLGDGIANNGALQGNVADGNVLVFANPFAQTYSGQISGAGTVTKIGAGTLVLSGSNNYSGLTTVSDGTLQIGAGGASGSVAGSIVNNGVVTFSRSNSVTYSNIISGTGSLIQAGRGTLLLSGPDYYTGTTTISAGTLQLGDGAALSGNIADSSVLVFANFFNQTYPGQISGSGSVTKIGAGTLVLTGSNGYSGVTTVSAGTLQIGEGGSGASIGNTSAVVDNGGLVFNHGDTLAFDPVITGSGSLTQAGPGALILTNSNSYTGTITISGGTLQIGNGGNGALMGSTSSVTDNASLVFDTGNAVSIHAVVSGKGSVTQIGSGIVTLTNASSYTGTTTVDGGTLQIANGGGILATSSEYVGSSGTGTIAQSGGNNSPGMDLYLGYNSGSSGTYNLSSNGQIAAPVQYVGYAGAGAFTQSGGNNNCANFYLGYNAGSNGTYNLSGNGLLSASSEYIGYSGTGSFTQSGGNNSCSNRVGFYLGYNAGSGGTYNLSGNGLLSASFSEYVGYSGTGSFTQSGGNNNCSFGVNLCLGYNAGSSGTYNLSGNGLVSVSSFEYVGYSGTGSFTQSGGTNSCPNGLGLYLGYNTGSSGTYNLSGNAVLTAANEYVGWSGAGVFAQTGGTNRVRNILFIGGTGSTAAYHLSGSGLLSAPIEDVGGTGPGTFTQSGGTNSVTSLSVRLGTPYSLNGAGQLLAQTENVYGIFTQAGGTNRVSGPLLNDGVYSLSGSGLVSALVEYVGDSGTGTFTQTGGTNTAGSLCLGYSSGSSGAYVLDGGVLNLLVLSGGSGAAAFNVNGGTL